jgi:F0F1-type ATP synthase assembly protein I
MDLPPVDISQRRELNKGLGDGFTLAFELVLTPALLTVIGLLVDRVLGTGWIFAVVLGVLGLAGVVAKTYYVYCYQMEQHEEGRPWASSR